MPKLKTKTAAKYRIKVTGSGKLLRGHPMRSHLLEKKSSRRVRRLTVMSEVSRADRKRVRKMLGL